MLQMWITELGASAAASSSPRRVQSITGEEGGRDLEHMSCLFDEGSRKNWSLLVKEGRRVLPNPSASSPLFGDHKSWDLGCYHPSSLYPEPESHHPSPHNLLEYHFRSGQPDPVGKPSPVGNIHMVYAAAQTLPKRTKLVEYQDPSCFQWHFTLELHEI